MAAYIWTLWRPDLWEVSLTNFILTGEANPDDVALISCIREDNTHTTYFTSPPFNDLTLFFVDSKIEQAYRKSAWKGLKAPPPHHKEETSSVRGNFLPRVK